MTTDVTFDQLLLDATEQFAAGNTLAARAWVDKALSRKPGEPRALSLLANILVAQKDHASATAIFKQLLQQFPNEPVLHFKLGCEYFAQGDIHLGYAEVEQAVLADPSNQEAVSFYQQVRRMLGLPIMGPVVPLSDALAELLHFIRNVLDSATASPQAVMTPEGTVHRSTSQFDTVIPQDRSVDEEQLFDDMPIAVPVREEHSTDRLCLLDIQPGPHLVFTPECVKIPVNGSWFVREKLILCWHMGLNIEPAQERYQGQFTNRRISSPIMGDLLHCQGQGVLVLVPSEKQLFLGFNLLDSPLYVMEEHVVAFSGDLRWENGWLRVENQKIPLISFRGSGSVILQLTGRLYSVPLPEEEYLIASVERLVGWDGHVVAQYSHSHFIQVAGSGSLLLES